MGGAGLVFDNLGLNMVSIVGRSPSPAILYLNRSHGEEVEVLVEPLELGRVFQEGRGGFYSLLDHTFARFGQRYETDPRILAVGPAALATDFGAIGSAPIVNGKLTPVDTWAGRGGLGSSLAGEHGIAAIIYGGTFLDEDFRNREVADKWFQERYQKKVAAKDFEATTKYRFDPKFGTGGTFGVNYASIGGRLLAFNYRTIYMEEAERRGLHERFIRDHYLKQFNEESIQGRQQATCGEPCVAVCKKMNGEFKKDYEPYQALGPLCGVFDQRAAESLVRAADAGGFDAIGAGGVVAWLLECLDRKLLLPEELGVKDTPVFAPEGFAVERDSAHNARLGVELLRSILEKRGLLDLSEGPRKLARRLSRTRGREVLDLLLVSAFGRQGWMVPNQYWTPGVLAPMAVVGKYYMYYGEDFLPPRRLGRGDAPGDHGHRVRAARAVPGAHRGHGQPPQLPQRLGVLGVGALRRLRAHLSAQKARGGWGQVGRTDGLAGTLPAGQAGGRPGVLVRAAQGRAREPAGVLEPPPAHLPPRPKAAGLNRSWRRSPS